MILYATILIYVITLNLRVDATPLGSEDRRLLSGVVTDTNHQPVPGATIRIFRGDSVVAGTSTDTDGYFSLHVREIDNASIKVSAIGYAAWSTTVAFSSLSFRYEIRLEQIEVLLPSIAVSPEPETNSTQSVLSALDVRSRSRESIVPSNPTAAIQSPQIVRRGSQHSSNLRINGTSPTFFINGNKIGYDPNHYGAFSIIPGGIVDEIRVSAQGTSAKYGLPSVVEMKTTTPFESGFDGEANLSVIASDGFLSIGKKDFFLTGSARKSVIDKIAKEFNLKSEHQTIPPTNFRDIFISSGLRLSSSSKIVLDAYQVQDFLSLESGMATGRKGGVSSFLHTKEWFAGGRYEITRGNWFIQAATTTRSSFETYSAFNRQNYSRGLQLDLTEKAVTSTGALDVTHVAGNLDLSAGVHGEYVSRRETDLQQQNWNFQPPDASSDLPSLYQPQLNAQYGEYHGSRTSASGDGYLSLKVAGSKLSHEHGIRVDYFRNLSHSTAFSVRQQVHVIAPLGVSLDAHFGTYAETPINRILEPWQAIIRAEESNLQPIRTTLAAVSLKKWGIALGAFTKRMNNVPAVIPPQLTPVGLQEPNGGQLAMKSMATQQFTGWDISYTRDNCFLNKLAFYGYYSHSRAGRRIVGWQMPHELDIPNRLFASVDYTGFRKWSFGASVIAQSGAPYTPVPEYDEFTADNPLPAYLSQVSKENSLRLPYNVNVNLRTQYSFDHGTFYFSVTNVTNRDNVIIHSYRGYIYDAGIMPSLGVSYRW
jgi:Carboxypeptidase regulatory-like domain